MEFTPLTVIAGLNASGKSNLFDALLLLSRLASTDIKTAFNEQRGDPSELFTIYPNGYAKRMSFEVEMLLSKSVQDNWGGEASLKYTRLRYKLQIIRKKNDYGIDDLLVDTEELTTVKSKDDQWIKRRIEEVDRTVWRPKVKTGKRGVPYIYTEHTDNAIPRIIVPQDGIPGGNKKTFPAAYAHQTVLSGINSVDFPHVYATKLEMQSWNFLQLNPKDLRQPTKQEPGMSDRITANGGNLAAALYRITLKNPYSKVQISRKLNRFLPHFVEVEAVDDKANKQYIIHLKGEDGRPLSSRVLSEGTLRLLVLCVLKYDPEFKGLLCFEEPENGIHPSRLRAMAKLLRSLSINFAEENAPLRQVIVNTHSPVLISHLIQFQSDRYVSIGLSQLKTVITNIDGKKVKIKATDIAFAEQRKDNQLELSITENRRKLTIAGIKEYLETLDILENSTLY